MLAQMLAPAAVLIAWSLLILFWMAFTRLPALSKAGGLGAAKPGGRGQDLEGVIPDKINWKSHNYAHLMEQPTLFYAASVIIALLGASALDTVFAWIYVGLRIIHSLVQVTANVVMVRFVLFALSSVALIALSVNAAMLVFGTHM